VVIPKSSRPERLAENIAVFEFQLSDDELARIAALDSGASIVFDHRDPQIVDRLSGHRLS
jgi:2,5-diketo-D-gluconate reductase A